MLLDALASSALPAATNHLLALARGPDPADRAKVAEALAGRATARAELLTLLADRDASVRAAAVWSLGTIGTAADVPVLERALRDADVAVAANAAAALGRVAERTRTDVTAELCGALGDARAYVRANALTGLRSSAGRCSDDRVLRLLARDRIAVVRIAAAANVASARLPAEKKALDRCAAEDENPAVAAVCAGEPLSRPSAVEAVLVYVVPSGESEVVPRAPFALHFGDGAFRLGLADRRGAVSERFAPKGDVELGIPGSLTE
jgi:hypothetical protein